MNFITAIATTAVLMVALAMGTMAPEDPKPDEGRKRVGPPVHVVPDKEDEPTTKG